jgi:hypothetical protein
VSSSSIVVTPEDTQSLESALNFLQALDAEEGFILRE